MNWLVERKGVVAGDVVVSPTMLHWWREVRLLLDCLSDCLFSIQIEIFTFDSD